MGARRLEAFGCHLCRPSTSPGFPPRIGVRDVILPERRSGVAVWRWVVVSRLAFFRGMLVRGFPPSRE